MNMYICICKRLTDHELRKAVIEDEVHCMREVRTRLNACDQCGKCAADAKRIISESTREKNFLQRYSAQEAA